MVEQKKETKNTEEKVIKCDDKPIIQAKQEEAREPYMFSRKK